MAELVIMAAGLGSRYGGLKQIDAMDSRGHSIMEYSVFDAVKAGFSAVTFVVNPATGEQVKQAVKGLERHVEVKFALQSSALPEGFSAPILRTKPWGTAHAVLSCKDVVRQPFAVVNSDDFYGRHAYEKMFAHLSSAADGARYDWAMVGYRLINTLTDKGGVTRGLCDVSSAGVLNSVVECQNIYRRGDSVVTEKDGVIRTLAPSSLISMNMWGFTPSVFGEFEEQFCRFIREELPADPLKKEFFLPTAVGNAIRSGKAEVKVLQTEDNWYGVTYAEDKAAVMRAFDIMLAEGKYPCKLLD